MNLSTSLLNWYKKIKQILEDSNAALINKGLNSVSSLSGVIVELKSVGINRLPYVLKRNILEITNEDLTGVTSIGDYAFYYCRNLENITIPNSVTSIGESAFYYCECLKNITIPDSVTSIAIRAFTSCYGLTDIYLNPITPPSLGGYPAIPDTTTIHVPVGSGDAYKSATNWSYYADKIVEDIVIE